MSDGIKYRNVGQKKLEKEGFVGLTDLMKRMKGNGLMITSATRDKDHKDYNAKSSHSKGNALDFGVKNGDADSYMKFFFGPDADFKTNAENLTLTSEGKQYLVDHNAELLDERGMVSGGDEHGTHPHFHLEFNSPTDGVDAEEWDESNFQDGTSTTVGDKDVTKWGVNNAYYKNDFQESEDYSNVTKGYQDTIVDSGSSSVPIGEGSAGRAYMTQVGEVKGYTWTKPNGPMNKEERLAYRKTYGGKLFNERLKRLESTEGWRHKGYFPNDDSGMTVGYGIDLSQISTVKELMSHGIEKTTAEAWEKLGVLGKTKKELEDEGKKLGALKLAVYIPNTETQKSDMATKSFALVDEKLKKYQGKISDSAYVALSSNIHFSGSTGVISADGYEDEDALARKSHASATIYQSIDKWIEENPGKEVPDKLIHKAFKSSAKGLEDNGSPLNSTTFTNDAENLFNDSEAAGNYHVRENVVSDYDYSAEGDGATIEALIRRETAGEELTEEETDYLYNAQLNNHEVFYQAAEAAKNTKGIMTEADIALIKKNKNDPDSLTPEEKKELAVINKEADALENDLNVEATDDALVRIDETGGLGPAVKATEETAERTEVDTGLVAGDSTAQDDAMRIAKGEADHEARIKTMLEDFDSYNEDGTLITEAQVKAKQDAEDKLNQDKLDAANSEKKEGQMRKAEMALTGLKAAAGILSLSQALRAPDVETPELDPLIYEALQKQKALSESGLTAKEKGAAMQNMNDAYAGAMKNVLRASGGQRGMYLANQGTVDAQRIQGLNQLAAQDAALHRQNIKEYNALATSVGSMKLNRDMNVEQMKQATLNNNRQILSGVGSNLLSDAISDVSYYMNPNRKATEDLIKNLSGKKDEDDGYDNPLLTEEITTANKISDEQKAINAELAKNAKETKV